MVKIDPQIEEKFAQLNKYAFSIMHYLTFRDSPDLRKKLQEINDEIATLIEQYNPYDRETFRKDNIR